jgi:hypothetical protein
MIKKLKTKYPYLLKFGLGIGQVLLTLYVYYNFNDLNILLYIISILKIEKIKEEIDMAKY